MFAGVELNDPFANSHNGGLGPIVGMELMENIADMIFDGFLAEIQHIGNFFVRFAIGNQLQNRNFSFGEIML